MKLNIEIIFDNLRGRIPAQLLGVRKKETWDARSTTSMRSVLSVPEGCMCCGASSFPNGL